MSNCRNCGAPLTRTGECPYCGTKTKSLQGGVISRFEITADSILFESIQSKEDDDYED